MGGPGEEGARGGGEEREGEKTERGWLFTKMEVYLLVAMCIQEKRTVPYCCCYGNV